MAEIHHAHPAILRISQIDTIPAMVFIQRQGMVVVRFKRQILDTTVSDYPLLLIDDGLGSTPSTLYAQRDGCIQRQFMAVNSHNLAIPTQVNVTRMPRPIAHSLTSAKRLATERLYPFFGRRADDGKTLAWF